jgi:hypothetical protein
MSAADWGLVVPTKGSDITSYRTPFINLAESVANSLDKVNLSAFPRYAKLSDLPTSGQQPRQHATVYADPVTSNNGDYYWNGTAWITIGPFGIAAGQVYIGGGISNGATTPVNLTFPSGRFTQTPRLTATPWNSRITVGIATITAAGATLNCSNFSGAAAQGGINIDWQAQQMTSGSANG